MSWGAIQVWVVGGLESSFRTSPPLLLNLDLDSLWCNLHFFSAVENLGRGSVSTLRCLALHIWTHHSLEQTWIGSKCARWQQWGMTWEEADGDWELFKKKNKNLNGCARHPSSSQRPNRMSIKIGYSLRNLTWRSILSVPFKNVLPPLRNCRISANSSLMTFDCFSKAGLFFERYWNVVITSLGQGSFSSMLDKRNLTLIRMFSCLYKILHRLTSRQPFLSQGLNNIWQNYETAWNWRSLNAPKQLHENL